MRILIVNKFLFENGGSETYIFRLGEYFQSIGHEVQFFGMEDERNIVGNKWNILTKNLTFKKISLRTLLYPFKIIYSREARCKIKRIMELFDPDVVHLNNINFQITPSIIYEIHKHKIPIIFTAHDYQLICPNHMLYQPNKSIPCEKCISSGFIHCVKNNCIHGSKFRSILGFLESKLYHSLKTYSLIDMVICPSAFLEKKFLCKSVFRDKTVVMHNFYRKALINITTKKGNYALYFGRFTIDKGIRTLINVCKRLPEIQFIFAGSGPLEASFNNIQNIKNVGFLKGDNLIKMISEARLSICPSEWYENYPYSVVESLVYGTPVICSEIGGIPEIIKNNYNGLFFEPSNEEDLFDKISLLWYNKGMLDELTGNCSKTAFDTPDIYGQKLLSLYNQTLNRE